MCLPFIGFAIAASTATGAQAGVRAHERALRPADNDEGQALGGGDGGRSERLRKIASLNGDIAARRISMRSVVPCATGVNALARHSINEGQSCAQSGLL